MARRSVRFEYEIRRLPDGEKLVSGHTVHACIDARGKVARLPKALARSCSAQERHRRRRLQRPERERLGDEELDRLLIVTGVADREILADVQLVVTAAK